MEIICVIMQLARKSDFFVRKKNLDSYAYIRKTTLQDKDISKHIEIIFKHKDSAFLYKEDSCTSNKKMSCNVKTLLLTSGRYFLYKQNVIILSLFLNDHIFPVLQHVDIIYLDNYSPPFKPHSISVSKCSHIVQVCQSAHIVIVVQTVHK